MSIINKKLASILDKKQVEAQNIFPHYYERFKTDGVEHNLYIGASIAPTKVFDSMYLHNLRLWQLQTLCEMELEHHLLKSSLPYELDVTSLILVFSSPITIRFRMDEKRFDVDGTYNARYEVVKKRIDKANIKGTKERITQKEKITIVYSHNQEETEYLNYIKFLQFKKILEPTIEQFEVEELQGVSGLRAIRVKVINDNKEQVTENYSYQDLLDELN
jgi:predicted secreted protein